VPRTIHYSIDDGVNWTVSESDRVTVAVSSEGAHHLVYYASDFLAAETVHAGYVNVDNSGPVTAGKSTSGRKGKTITLKYRATDALSSLIYAPKVVVKTVRGKVVWTCRTSATVSRTSGAWFSVRWKPKAKGAYRYFIYAKDAAGNAQDKVGSAKVVVR
jgi:hypothetical protein